MKKFYFKNFAIIFLIVVAFGLLCSNQTYAQVAAGNHTVGPTGTFADLTEVRDTLEGYGIVGDGHVIFNIEDGTHDWGEIAIDQVITNVDASNTITFQSESESASACTLQTSTAERLFYFLDCDYITIQHLTLINNYNGSRARGIYLNGTATNMTIKHNIYWGYGSQAYDNDYAFIYFFDSGDDYDNLIVDSNQVNDGSYFLYTNTGLVGKSTNCKIRGNTVNSFGGIQLYNFDGVEISGNTFNFSFAQYAINLVNCELGISINNNFINLSYTSNSTYGINLNSCAASGGNPGKIYNNSITINGVSNHQVVGINLSSSCQYQQFYHNSINITEGDADSFGFYTDGGANNSVENNVFSLEIVGLAIGCSDATGISASNYNCFYTEGSYIGYWDGGYTNRLSNWQTASSLDANSVMADPHFVSDTDLRPKSHYLDNTANDVGIAEDFNGDTRTEYDMGAFEYEPFSSTVFSSNISVDISGGGDYTSLASAIDSLVKYGISAPITISIADGTYPENVEFRHIPRTNETDLITVESASADASSVEFVYSSSSNSDNYVFLINNSNYLTFNNLTFTNSGGTYARLVRLNGNSSNVTIDNCVFNGSGGALDQALRAPISCTNDDINDMTITNNVFNNGDRGISLTGVGSTDEVTGLVVANNEFNGYYYSLFLQDFTGHEIYNNTFDDFTWGGVVLYQCTSPFEVYNNKLNSSVTTGVGMSIYDCIGGGNIALIYNNFIYISHSSNQIRGIRNRNSDYLGVYYNSIYVESSNSGSSGIFYDDDGYSKSNNFVKNNNVFVDGSGYALDIQDGSDFDEVDYNNYYTYGLYIARWTNVSHYSLVSLNASSGQDANSINHYPGFISVTDLSTNSSWLDGMGTSLVSDGITTDINGLTRDAVNPDIGAVEYSSTLVPYNDSLTVGTGEQFESLTEVIDSIVLRGISDTVVVSLVNGTYNEQVEIPSLSGTSSTSPLIIRSSTGNSDNVTLTFAQTLNDNYIIKINGSDYVNIENLKFVTSGTTYSINIRLTGNSTNINLNGNQFVGLSPTGHDYKSSIYLTTNDYIDELSIDDNVFSSNGYGIYHYGTNLNTNNISIANNTFNGQYQSVYAYRTYNLNISNNYFTGVEDMAIYLNQCDADHTINGNIIDASVGDFWAIYLLSCDGTPGEKGLISNNMIYTNQASTRGIYLNSSTYQQVLFNTIDFGPSANHAAFYTQTCGNIEVENNIFHVAGSSYAYNTNNASGVVTSDFNNIFSSGTNFATYNGSDYANLAELQAASSKDASSVSIEPQFMKTNSTDLHLANEDLMGLGDYHPQVPEDIDGEARDLSTPDIGADELYCESLTVEVADTSVCQFEELEARIITTGYADNAQFFWDFDNDGTNDDTTTIAEPDFTYTYLTTGTKTAKLTIAQLGGCSDQGTFEVNVIAKPSAPVTADSTGCSGETIPLLTADGTNLMWYSNAGLSSLLHDGDTLNTGISTPDTTSFWVTQTVNGCTSDASEVELLVIESPAAPESESAVYCLGDEIANLTATGTNINWYADAELSNPLLSANEYNTGITAPGDYYYYVTQTNETCQSLATEVNVLVHDTPTIDDDDVTDIDCGPNPYGTINITPDDGTSPYFFEWSNGETTEDIVNLAAGWYYVTVEDINECFVVDSFEVEEPPILSLDFTTNDADCGEPNGDATVVVTGGQAPFTYQWDYNGEVTASIDTLNSGVYTVTVTDFNSCEAIGVATINDLGGPTIEVDSKEDVSCYGLSDGEFDVDITGGFAPYEILWSNSETTASIKNIPAGPYEMVVTDGSGCKSILQDTIYQPDPIFIDLDVFDANCDQNDGKATANVSGGTPAYSYAWSVVGNTNELLNLGLGVYRLTITDNNECEAIKSFAVSEIGAPTIAVDSIFEGTCGNEDGAIYITPYGAYLEYAYLWSNDSTNQDLIGVDPGEYSVTVTDSANCASAEVIDLSPVKPDPQAICIVSVDTATNFNEVVWEKAVTDNISHYNIYKETTQSNVYAKIGEHPYDSISIYVDSSSNALQRSSRYKIAAVDICGTESELSDHHKTMHLSLNLGLSNTVNLLWDHYEGFDFSTYYIYRYTSTEGWVKYDSIQNNLTSYTDFNPPFADDLYYFIEIVNPDGCTATKATDRRSSRSNVGSITSGGAAAYDVTFIINDGTNPIEGAEVVFNLQTLTTNASGEVVFEDLANGTYNYEVSATGFINESGTITVDDADITETLSLTAGTDTIFDVTIVVTDGTNPIESAAINFDGDNAFTNEAGEALFADKSPGTYNYSIVASGFNEATGTITVVDEDVTEEVTMIALGIWNIGDLTNLTIYPNPNTGNFYLSADVGEKTDLLINIYSPQGTIAEQIEFAQVHGKLSRGISLTNHSSGIYYIQIITNKSSIIRKIIVE